MKKYRFGAFELDLDRMQLSRDGAPVRLERRPLDLLVILVKGDGRLVSRDELIATLWPQNVVIDFDTGLNTLVRKVRTALGDAAETPTFIETVPGRGYRFVATVVPESSPVTQGHERPATTAIRLRGGWLPIAVVIAGVAIVIAGAWRYDGDDTATISIAVLPFQNLTGDDGLAFLASGLAEETSASLTRINGIDIRVIGDVSTRAGAQSLLPARQIGRELGADYVVLSSLHVERPMMRVNARLLRVSDSEEVWAGSFDRELTNYLGLQSELSIAIAEQIRQRLSPEVTAAIERRQTRNPLAYELYLKGRHQWSFFLPSSNRAALGFYERAVAIDPDYALAWAGIALLHSTSIVTTDVDPNEIEEDARDALDRALASDEGLAEVQYAKGYVALFIDWNLAAAEAAARRAVTLDPNSAIAHVLLGVVLSEQGNDVEAIAVMRRARELDPLFSQTFAISAMTAWHAGDADAAREFSRQAIAISPEGWVGHLHLGYAYLGLGDFADAASAFADALRLSGGNSLAVAAHGYALGRAGQTDEARAMLDRLLAATADEPAPSRTLAAIYSGLGETDSALDWLYTALRDREIRPSSLRYELSFAQLHQEPRFGRLLEDCATAC